MTFLDQSAQDIGLEQPAPAAEPDDPVAQLRQCVEAAASVEGVDAAACRQLRDRITQGRFSLVVAGEFNRGKSTLVNALLGAELMPAAIVPLTSVLTMVRHGERPGAVVRFQDRTQRDIDLRDLPEFVTERANPRNVKGVDSVVLHYPSPWLASGLQLIDTPGIGSIHQHNTDIAYRVLPRADAVLFVVSADQPLGHAELDFLSDIRRHAGKVVCLMNKVDQLGDDERREAEAFVGRAVRDALDAEVPVIAISAREALAGQLRGEPARIERSGMPALQAALQRLLGEERRTIWLTALSSALLRILRQARLAVGVELESLRAPLEQTRARLEAFGRLKREALQALNDDDTLLTAEARKLVKQGIEPELERFVGGLRTRFESEVDRFAAEHAAASAHQLQSELETHLVDAVRRAYDDWRGARDAELAQAFDALGARFWGHVEAIGDELLRQSAELFELPYEAVRGGVAWQPQERLRYKFWSEPTSLSLLGASLAARLPRPIGVPLVLRRARHRAVELVDTQAGRVRHDLEERVKEAARSLSAQLQGALENAVAAIENAVAAGTALRDQGETEAQRRRIALEQAAAAIDALQTRLQALLA
jgi:GTP-binding protein EngB required for normal cell division